MIQQFAIENGPFIVDLPVKDGAGRSIKQHGDGPNAVKPTITMLGE